MIGQVLDARYRVLSLLGQGGMGKVYLAEHVVLEKRLAVKVLHDEYSRHAEVMHRFQQEAIAASRIGQENIVNVTDFGRTPEGALYFVMEALEGESLGALIRNGGACPLPRALPILAQICRALTAAHDCGIVHRDLKPENVLLVRREDGSELVKVLDFGISKVNSAESGGGRITQAGVIMGTPDYMAPEQARGLAMDHRVDIYSFGVLAYELVTGALPFPAETPIAVLLRHQTDVPESVRARRPDLALPPGLDALILKALAKRPEDRYADLNALAKDLNVCLAQAGIQGFNLSPFRRSYGDGAPTRSPSGVPVPPVSSPSGAGSDGTWIRPSQAPAPVVLPQAPIALWAHSEPLEPEELAAVRRHRPRWRWVVLALGVAGGGLAALTHGGKKSALNTPPLTVEATPPPVGVPPPQDGQLPAEVVTPPLAEGALSVLSLRSEPRGASIFDGRKRLGATPLELSRKLGSVAVYRFSLPGYRPVLRRIQAGDGTVNIVLLKARRSPDAHDASSGDSDLKSNPFPE